VTNLLDGDFLYSVDGFNNRIFVYPIVKDCTNTDMTTCSIVAPQIPQEDYYTLKKPPYTSYVFTKNYASKGVTAPEFGRILVSY
jgi:hypothetical protein